MFFLDSLLEELYSVGPGVLLQHLVPGVGKQGNLGFGEACHRSCSRNDKTLSLPLGNRD